MAQLPSPPEDRYIVRGRDGQDYAIDRNTLRQWVQQGRITPDHQVYSERMEQWMYADEIPWLPRGNQQVVVTDIKMPFGSMVIFMVKWTLAAIPAVIILAILVGLIMGSIFAGVGGR